MLQVLQVARDCSWYGTVEYSTLEQSRVASIAQHSVVQFTIDQLEGAGELFKNSWTLFSSFSRMHASWSARAPK